MHVLTPVGTVAGVAVFGVTFEELRVAGAELVSRSGRRLQAPCVGVPLSALVVGGRVLDDVLVVARGDGVELHTHGAPCVFDAMQGAFPRAIPAQSPAARLLQEAMSLEQFDVAAEQLCFDFAAEMARIDRLPEPERTRERCAAGVRSRAAMAHAVPERVVLIGGQNAGKSMLFNKLLVRERSLAGPTAGLTRDPIHELTTMEGYPYELVDTAGECGQRVAWPIDMLAIESGRAQRGGARLILVIDASRGPSAVDRELLPAAGLVVANKCDLSSPSWPVDFPCHARVSAKYQDAPALRLLFGSLLRELRLLRPAGAVGGFAALQPSEWAQLQG